MNLPDAVPTTRRSFRPTRWLPPSTIVGVALAITAVLSIAVFTYRTLASRESSAERFAETLASMERIEALLTTIANAESSQRGFLIARDEDYLRPFQDAEAGLTPAFEALRVALRDNPVQLQRLATVEQLAREKFAEMTETIRLQRAGDSIDAQALVKTDRGEATMQRIRATTADMKRDEAAQVASRQAAWRDAVRFSIIWAWTGSGILIALIVIAAFVMSREYRAREQLAWMRAARAEFGARILGEQSLPELGRSVLGFLVEYLDARVGAVYIAESGGTYRRFAAHALPAEFARDVLRPGDGVLGQAAIDKRAVVVRDVPAGHLPVTSAVGASEPRALVVAPAVVDGEVQALVELGFLREVHAADETLMNAVSEAFGVAVRSSRDRTRLLELLEETQRQSEELQAQQEELRVSNDELDKQAGSLRESQARLEEQQAELEQTNAHLEDQARTLEDQKDALSRAQGVLSEKANELQRANQYKSEFLANMSHELRTPLNSALILAKLLADNRPGNLNEEQIEFAQTIYSAGNDLLALINDIIDLSRIEAGRVRVEVAPVAIAALVDGLVRVHQPVARQKDLAFTWSIAPNVPERIETDDRRLGQILKNLLSNALKFTERGEVSLRVESGSPDRVSFVVTDTGIGVSEDQQQAIFEAFRQADGSMHRRYGGAGLGLSISRDLARLLGGDISVRSVPGEGSTFTLTVPRTTVARIEARRAEIEEEQRPTKTKARALAPIEIDDDRDRLRPDSRRILVIEDDQRFAAILRDLARQLSFHCVVAHTAADGLLAAAHVQPHAILLDVNLPDHSGLGVLDQLKRDPRTRHVPVHVVSVADHAKEALELGAVGYALKPVRREELVEMFQGLERRLTRTLRRVLVVEDDERQREGIRSLLENDGVEIVGVATAGEAVIELRAGTFDCVVLDHNLPDLSGRDLLEQMANEDDVSFPPVIVYTGRALKREEELQLRRYARSIIVKDARSPERLLDEVTLFLHQVESKLPAERQQMLKVVRDREALLEGRRILVVEDDVRNIFALSRVLEPKGVTVEIARNGREALEVLARPGCAVDLVLMDIMMPEMDGLTAMREIRKRPEWTGLPIIALTAKAMRDDQEACLAAGANDYIAKPLDVDKLLSLIRVWMPK